MLGSRLELMLVMVMLIANSFNTHEDNELSKLIVTNYSTFVLKGI